MERIRTRVFSADDRKGIPHIVYEFTERRLKDGKWFSSVAYEIAREHIPLRKITGTEFEAVDGARFRV